MTLVLASSSKTRAEMLKKAGVAFEAVPAAVDEAMIRASLLSEGAKPPDIADALAEYKARRVSAVQPERPVLGADQVLHVDGVLFSKADDRSQAADVLRQLRGRTHHLLSAAVIYDQGTPVWRHVSQARMTMHTLTDAEIEAYLDMSWPDVSGSVGAYQFEATGVRLFSRVEGDWFTVLGLPLLEVLSYLRLRGWLSW